MGGQLELSQEGRAERIDKVIWTGTHVFIFDAANKTILFADQPSEKGPMGALSMSLLDSFLFGIKTWEVKSRYQITYVPPTDKWYVYLKILPKTARDRLQFKEARLALNANTLKLRQIWILQTNGDEVTWDFPRTTLDDPLVQEREFRAPVTPAGWDLRRIPLEGFLPPCGKGVPIVNDVNEMIGP